MRSLKLALVLLLLTSGVASGQETPMADAKAPPAGETSGDTSPAGGAAEAKEATAEKKEFQSRYAEWQETLADFAAMQATLQSETNRNTPEFRQKVEAFKKLAEKANAEAEGVRKAAEAAYAKDPSDQEAGDLLFHAAIDDLRRDRFEDSLRLAQMLIDNKYKGPNSSAIYRIAASAALSTMQLDLAKKYIEEAAKNEAKPDPAFQQFLAQIAKYESLWKREQELREAEAKADDLPRVKIQTNQGDIVVELFENEAPNTVANFISLVEKGFYDGIQFHRVLPSFMAQVGDPRMKELKPGEKRATDDGPGYSIACECVRPDHRMHFRGTLSMAHAGPNTGGSQFFLTFSPTAHLDGAHTVFGRVIEGMDVLDKLERVDPQKGEAPVDKIIKAEVIRKRDHEYKPEKLSAK